MRPTTYPPVRAATARISRAWSPHPGLLGLRADYISAQLGAWRYGTRTAAEPDCMQIVADDPTRRTSRRSPRLAVASAAGSVAGARGYFRRPFAVE